MRNSILRPLSTLKRSWHLKWKWALGDRVVEANAFAPLRFRCGNATEHHRTAGYGGELSPLGAFLFLLEPDDVVWDVGASVGLFTAHAGRVVRKVVAYEPDLPTFERLNQNIALNSLGDRVQTVRSALGESVGSAELSSDGLDGNAPSMANLGRHRSSTSVSVSTIEAELDRGIQPPTVIKIDIEGAEALALRGGRGLLSGKLQPRLIFMEVHPQFIPAFGCAITEPTDILERAGYKVLALRRRDEQFHVIAIRGD